MNGDAIVDSTQVIHVVKEGGIAIGGAAAGAQFQWKQDVTVSLTPGADIATYLVQLKVERGNFIDRITGPVLTPNVAIR